MCNEMASDVAIVCCTKLDAKYLRNKLEESLGGECVDVDGFGG